MDDKTMLEWAANQPDPYNLHATVMPLVDLLNAGPISWADRQEITRAICGTLRAYKSLMAEREYLNGGAVQMAAQSRIAELEETAERQRAINTELNGLCVDYCKRIAELEAEVAHVTALHRNAAQTLDGVLETRRSVERELTESREREGRMREASDYEFTVLLDGEFVASASSSDPAFLLSEADRYAAAYSADGVVEVQLCAKLEISREQLAAIAADKEQK